MTGVQGSATAGFERSPLNGGLDLWVLIPDEDEQSAIRRCLDLMSRDEKVTLTRIPTLKGQQQYALARGLVRTSLSHYAGAGPRDLAFQNNAYGKPSLVRGDADPVVHFNLSHTEELMVCAVSFCGAIGADIEMLKPQPAAVRLAKRFFSPREAAAVAMADDVRRDQVFWRYWVLKEAYLKAIGRGIASGMSGASFVLDEHSMQLLAATSEATPRVPQWAFHLRLLGEKHVLALCVEGGQGIPVRVLRAGKDPAELFSYKISEDHFDQSDQWIEA